MSQLSDPNIIDQMDSASNEVEAHNVVKGEWYIGKYQRLTEDLKRISDGSNVPQGFDVFFPFYMKPTRRGKTIKEEYVPILPGYIFVKGSHCRILSHPAFSNLFLLSRRSDHTPITIRECQMKVIQNFASMFQKEQQLLLDNLHLETEAVVTFEDNDYVEMLEGPLRGLRGLLRMQERSKQATFYYVLEPSQVSEDASQDQAEPQQVPEFHDGADVQFAFDVTRDQVKVIRFGTNNGHARDFIGKAYHKALALLKSKNGKRLSEAERKAVMGYVVRYGEVETEGLRQKAHLCRMLYACHAVLGNVAICQRILTHIEKEIYNEYKWFAAGKRTRKERIAASHAFGSYRCSIEEISSFCD